MKILFRHINFYLLLASAIFRANAQLHADFSANQTEGCNQLAVNFQNLSTPTSGLTYYWDFGNGTVSTVKNPVAIFSNPGNYTVKLKISNGTNSDSITKIDFIKLHPNPQPAFNVTPSDSGCAPLNVAFSDQTISGTPIIQWHWDLGDGTESFIQNPVHTYTFQNSFGVSLFVKNADNCQNTIFLDNLIKVFQPIASFSAIDTFSCNGILAPVFQNHSQNAVSYFWNFGDGNTSLQNIPNYVYSQSGIFSVSLTAKDSHQCSDTLTRKNYIYIKKVKADFTTYDDTVCLNTAISFNNISQLSDSYIWDFGDGGISYLKSPIHTYTHTGQFSIRLTVGSSFGCNDTIVKSIFVEKTTADFTTIDSFSCSSPIDIHYINKSQNADFYYWYFGNKTTSTEFEPTVTLTQNGIYYDTLKVVSRHGCQSVKISSRAFEVKVPQANFSPNFFIRSSDTQGCVPLTVNFKDETLYVTPNDYIENRNWNFGDNATSTIQNPVHTFATLNTFIVSLIIKTHRGCVSEYQYTVKTGTPQIASFTVSQPQNICASEQEQFINTSQDTNLINSYFWKFGDNTISVKKNPTHQFSDTGFMSVQLYVYNNGCVSFFKRDSVFYIKGPLAAPTYVLNCYSNFTPVFSAQVKGFDSFSWDFGDGSSLETLNLNPSHSYSQRGMYNVKFHASNSVTSCQTDVQKPIRITDITASYSRTDSVGCENLNVVFDGSTSVDNESIANGNVAGKYLWDFDDGSPKIVSNIAVTHKYKYNGIFHPRLTVEDIQGCFDTISHRIKISKPFVNFGTDSMNGCMPMTVYFKSLTQPDTTTSTWQWDFGDGQISSEENPIHVYNQFGQYSVQLKVVDVLTCESQITKNNFIKAQKPFPDFYATDRTLCAGDTIQFFSLSDDSISEYFWDFGNGKTSNSVAPFAVYPDSGSFNISLKLIDNVGCDSMQVLQKFIAVQKPPIPDFDADTLSSVCFPLTVQFNDLSAHSQLKNWLWNFGFGGAISVFKNPIFTYPRPGNYTVSLTVSSSFGCKAEISKSNYIQVGGPYAEFNLPDTACAWSAILFNEQNEQNVHTRKWYFGDGACFEGDSVFHGFDNSGFVYPTLFLTADENHTCDKYFQDTIFIQKPGAQMKSDVGFDGCIPLEIQLFDQTQTDVCRNWDFGNGFSSTEANPQTVYIKPGTFQVKLLVTDSKSCKDTSIQIINVFPLPTLKINNDTLICRGQSTDLSIFGAKTYSWYPKLYLDDYNSSNPTSNPDSTITYQVTAIDSDLCVNNAKTTVKVQQHPVANLKDTTVIIGETIRFNVYSKDIGNYSWSPESVVDCSNCSQISFKAIDPILISLAYSDTARCFTENTSSYISIRREYTVDVPNAFSPNGDGVNDVLYVRGWGIKDLSEFKIYNRFGEMVFSSQDINVGWDGTYKGKLQNIETYIYTVTVRNYDDQILTKKGTFKLLK